MGWGQGRGRARGLGGGRPRRTSLHVLAPAAVTEAMVASPVLRESSPAQGERQDGGGRRVGEREGGSMFGLRLGPGFGPRSGLVSG